MRNFLPEYSLFHLHTSFIGGTQYSRVTQRDARQYGGPSVNLAGGFGGCCGASEMTGWTYNWDETFRKTWGDDRIKQDFLWSLIYHGGGISQTKYFIATDSQINQYLHGAIACLREAGAKCVDETPNQVHGPNKMMLHVWAPKVAMEKELSKFLSYHEGYLVPNWWAKMTDAEQDKYAASPQVLHVRAQDVKHAADVQKARQSFQEHAFINSMATFSMLPKEQQDNLRKRVAHMTLGPLGVQREYGVEELKASLERYKKAYNEVCAERDATRKERSEAWKELDALRTKVSTQPKRAANGRFTKAAASVTISKPKTVNVA